MKNVIMAKAEDNLSLTKCVKTAFEVIMTFTIHTGLKATPLELHDHRKPRSELTNLIHAGKSYLSNWFN